MDGVLLVSHGILYYYYYYHQLVIVFYERHVT